MALILNPETGNVSSQFHVVFDNEFSTVKFIREGTIQPNWSYAVQQISQSDAKDNIDLKDTCFTPDLEEYPRKTPRNETIVVPTTENKNNMRASLPTKPYIHEDMNNK